MENSSKYEVIYGIGSVKDVISHIGCKWDII